MAKTTKQRLLVADDDHDFCDYVRMAAEKMGFEVAVTNDGATFKRRYESFDPTIIVLDMVMPDMDGVELVRWLAERHCNAVIMMVTGLEPKFARMARDLGTARGLNMRAFQKPMSLGDLRTALSA